MKVVYSHRFDFYVT